MTRKDYVAAAKMISNLDGSELYSKYEIIELFSRFFRDDNMRFEETRFRKACEVSK